MSNIGLNFNNINGLASLAQMFGGTNNGSSAMVSSIFNLINIGCTSTNYSNSTRNSYIAQMVLNYAPQLIGGAANFIGNAITSAKNLKTQEEQKTHKPEETQQVQQAQQVQQEQQTQEVQQTQQEQKVQQTTPQNAEVINKDEIISQVLENVGLKNSEELKRELDTKYTVMEAVAEENGKKLTANEITERLNNYAKGWKFNQFQTKACFGLEVPEYQSDCAKAKSESELKDAYKQFAKEYIEFYDQDGNNSISAEEMFFQELIEHYILEENLPATEAKNKAIQILENYKKNSYGLLEDGTVNLPSDNSTEASLYSEIINLLRRTESSLNVKNNKEFDVEEIAPYLHAMAWSNDNGNNITSSDALQMSIAIASDDGVLEKKLKDSFNYFNSIE